MSRRTNKLYHDTFSCYFSDKEGQKGRKERYCDKIYKSKSCNLSTEAHKCYQFYEMITLISWLLTALTGAFNRRHKSSSSLLSSSLSSSFIPFSTYKMSTLCEKLQWSHIQIQKQVKSGKWTMVKWLERKECRIFANNNKKKNVSFFIPLHSSVIENKQVYFYIIYFSMLLFKWIFVLEN